ARDVGGIIQVGGTFLGSARSAEFPEESGRSKAPFCPHPACAVMDCLQFNRSHPDSPVEGSGFEPVWGFSCQVMFWFVAGSLFGAGKPFLVRSPAIRFAERAEGVKGPKR